MIKQVTDNKKQRNLDLEVISKYDCIDSRTTYIKEYLIDICKDKKQPNNIYDNKKMEACRHRCFLYPTDQREIIDIRSMIVPQL